MATVTNYCQNPSVETNDTGYAQIGVGSTRSRNLTDAVSGSACMEFGVTGLAVDQGFEFSGVTGLNLPTGTVIYVTPYVKSVSGPTAFKVVPRFHYTDVTNGFGTNLDADLTTEWQRFMAPMTVPVGKTLDRINFRVTTRSIIGSAAVFRVDATMFTIGEPPDYFDGATTDTPAFIYDWTGTAHASTSTQTSTGLTTAQKMRRSNFELRPAY